MEFTNEESKELDNLLHKRASRSDWLSQEEQDRIRLLQKKMYHNGCLNPTCVGGYGNEEEKICKYCGHDLFKNNGK